MHCCFDHTHENLLMYVRVLWWFGSFWGECTQRDAVLFMASVHLVLGNSIMELLIRSLCLNSFKGLFTKKGLLTKKVS